MTWNGEHGSEVQTNADRIRAMSDEELANVLSWLNAEKTADGWLDWLQSPAGEVEG